MGWAALRTMVCTACRAHFPMFAGEMVHPADQLCDPCVRELWERLGREGAESVEAGLAARIQSRMGMAPEVLAAQIARRVQDLREMVPSRAELDLALEKRRRP
ncbi:MAG: hypothetical protein ACOZNI_28195 [Myxococcota bacterium]